MSLRDLLILIFLDELDGLDTQVIDIGNAYNEGEIIAIITGTKFGDLEGHILSIFKEIYGMRSDELIW